MASAVAIFPDANTLSFIPAVWNGLSTMGQAPYFRTIQQWQSSYKSQPYVQKVTFDDIITIQSHTQWNSATFGGPQLPTIYLLDAQGKQLTVLADLNDGSVFIKGYQLIPGNTFQNPDGSTTQLQSATWAFPMSAFFSYVANTVPITYFLRMDTYEINDDGSVGPLISYYSEPFLVNKDFPGTQIYQSSYNTNSKKYKVIAGGWYDAWPAATVPYKLVFAVRAESYAIVARSGPQVVNIGYFEQNYLQLQNQTTLLQPIYDLRAGGVSLGIPMYMLFKLTACIMADNFALINTGDTFAVLYRVYNANGSSSPVDAWKVTMADVDSLLFATCKIMQISTTALVTPTPVPIGDRIFDGVFDSVFA